MPRRQNLRIALAAAALVALAALAIGVLGSGGDYRVKARFVDAGQVVGGGLVQIAGRPVGKVEEIRLTDDNEAELELSIHEDAAPLHEGTIARIRTVGLSGVTNRYVDLTPGPEDAEEIEDGGVLQPTDTRPIVDLDMLLNALDEPTRDRLQQIIRDGDDIFEGTAPSANRALRNLEPAVAQTRALAEEISADTAAVGQLVTTGAAVVKALADRRDDVSAGITSTATALGALADERVSLQSALDRAPATLHRARGTLRRTRETLSDVRPALAELRPVADPLADLLRVLPGTSLQARPVLEDVEALLPSLTAALEGLPGLRDVALPALRSTASAVTEGLPIFTGLRPYAPDIVLGLFQGLGGRAAASYDANGHFARIGFTTSGTSGLLGGLPPVNPGGGLRRGLDARCPGAAAEPAPDGSNPFVPDPSLCDRGDDK